MYVPRCLYWMERCLRPRFSGYKPDDAEKCRGNVARTHASPVDVYRRSHQWQASNELAVTALIVNHVHFTGTAQVDHAVLRQISAIVSTLPVMTEAGFQDEFLTVSWPTASSEAETKTDISLCRNTPTSNSHPI